MRWEDDQLTKGFTCAERFVQWQLAEIEYNVCQTYA